MIVMEGVIWDTKRDERKDGTHEALSDSKSVIIKSNSDSSRDLIELVDNPMTVVVKDDNLG